MIIKSLADCDLYKISMLRMMLHYFPNVWAHYEFKCRNEERFTKEMVSEIRKEIQNLGELKFTEDELQYIGNLYWMKDAKWFIEFLRMFRLNIDYIHVEHDNNQLQIWSEGPIWQSSMFEIYVLAIVNEIYFKYASRDINRNYLIETGDSRLENKLDIARNSSIPFKFSDFGTRRRFSADWQDRVIQRIVENSKANKNMVFTGTSNVYFAKKYGITPIGTMAHEVLQMCQALDNVTVANSQKYCLQKWADEYRADLGIALTDNLGIDYFLKHDFDKYFAMLFSGVRHDSGDPIIWGEKIINHYKKLGIDPKTKQMVFSDGLDFPKAMKINEIFYDKCNVSFGIGTNLTNDLCWMFKPLNIVYKIVSANGKPVAKLSDSPGKVMCSDESYVEYLKGIIDKELSNSR